MPTTTDLAVIGAGPGGYTAAIRGAQKGLDVVLVERETVGGVCLNHGCIPAKALIHAAGFQKDIDHWNALGIETGPVDVDFDAIQDWKDSVIDTLDQQVLDSLDHHGVELIEGTARFVGSTTLHVDSDARDTPTIDFETAIIATGSQPIEIPGLEYEHDRVISSREILQVDEVPDEIVVVGGGYIGMEAVTKFSKFGARVKIVEALDRVLSEFEPEIVDSIQETSEMYSDDIYTSTLAQGVEYDDGTPVLVAEQDDEFRLSGDYIVVAAGREPNSAYERLALDTTDVAFTDDGFIAVNEQLQTADDNILAIGDAAGPPYLAHVAAHEGKVAAAVAAGEERAVDTEYMPTVMYTDPEVATVGLSEAEATEQYDDVLVGRVPMATSGRALTTDKTSGYLKVIADSDEQLLGVRIVGARASDTVAEATLALELDASLDDIATTMHAHPTFPETLVEAAEDAQGEAIHAS